MENEQESLSQLVTLERPKHHTILLTSADGRMFGLGDDGALELFNDAGDRVILDRQMSYPKWIPDSPVPGFP